MFYSNYWGHYIEIHRKDENKLFHRIMESFEAMVYMNGVQNVFFLVH